MTTTDSEQEFRLKLYGETRADLLKRQLSNSENVDRAILTVSTAALGFSLAFLKDVVPIQTADYVWLLYFSWTLFVLAIINTLFSFYTSQKAIDAQLELARLYYIQQDESALASKPKFSTVTDFLNSAGSIIFVAGLITACIFVGINLGKEQSVADKITTSGGTSTSQGQTVQKGAPIPSMQGVPVKPQGGAPVPGLQQVPTPPTTKPGSGSSGGK
ncbi:hypothetical protein [Dechloromonas sp. H13]|uniref:hypothetical protein n=1 Tax=Dechloromonas sp. H13 TaxID=2570193 RepID=UPI0012921814|nr:hypothetical protein [Dechloromonas sp. H13]